MGVCVPVHTSRSQAQAHAQSQRVKRPGAPPDCSTDARGRVVEHGTRRARVGWHGADKSQNDANDPKMMAMFPKLAQWQVMFRSTIVVAAEERERVGRARAQRRVPGIALAVPLPVVVRGRTLKACHAHTIEGVSTKQHAHLGIKQNTETPSSHSA